MANKKISALTNLGVTPATGDILPITDVDDLTGSAQGTTKGVTFGDLTDHLATQVSLGNHEALTSSVHGISSFGATLVDDADAATARTTLDVDQAGTDNSTDVSLDTALHDYLSLTGQTISLGAIDLSTDVTGLLPNTSVSGLGTAATTASSDYATAAHTHAIDDLSDVDTSTVTPTTNDFLKWGGSNWVPAVPTADVDTPLTIALRGTDNPHIGASPEQSFKVMDNPSNSAVVVVDADGNVTYVLKDSAAEVRVAKGTSGTPSRFALASDLPAFVLENDTGEPDIEVTEPTSGEKISVISGDSDAKGANGLPTRQGYNLPDIGANPAPLLISGGSIA